MPKFEVQDEYLELIDNPDKVKNTYDFLIALCQKGFKNLNLKRGSEEHKKYTDRIYYELDILKELGFVDYILLVYDVINYWLDSKENFISLTKIDDFWELEFTNQGNNLNTKIQNIENIVIKNSDGVL